MRWQQGKGSNQNNIGEYLDNVKVQAAAGATAPGDPGGE
jgi:hypothetical protein